MNNCPDRNIVLWRRNVTLSVALTSYTLMSGKYVGESGQRYGHFYISKSQVYFRSVHVKSAMCVWQRKIVCAFQLRCERDTNC